MAGLSLKVDTSEFERAVRKHGERIRKQVEFAAAVSVTYVARDVKTDLRKEIVSVFNNPITPWIKSSPTMEPATKATLTATVGIRDKDHRVSPAVYLKEHFAGGGRGNKPMEKAMQAMGILPEGWFAVPSADGVKKDSFGNVSKATVARILRELKSGGRKKGGGTYRLFVVRPGQAGAKTRHLASGIWSVARVGDQSVVKPVFLFVTRATYKKVIDLPRLAGKVVQRDFARHFNAALERAMRTAR